MTNTVALKELIRKKGLKMKYVAEYLGLSAYGFQLKVEISRNLKQVRYQRCANYWKLIL